MSLYRDPSEPVTAVPEDWCHGKCRVAAYEDPETGSLMYRVEKESSAPAPEAYLVCLHMTPTYCRDLLALIQAQEGGELRANGCMLLIPGVRTIATEAGTGVGEGGSEGGWPSLPRPMPGHSREGKSHTGTGVQEGQRAG